MTTNDKRLIETAFPLAEASAASLHEKNMRHGHISTLHLWPARRPMAASRAAIAAALIPDPGSEETRKQLVRRLGGRLVSRKKGKFENGRDVEVDKAVAEGGILWWGKENSQDLSWFRDEIRRANGGQPPRILDPFSGGGAIPLEAMRLGCEVEANDLNPVAWLILRCTLEFPQLLAGKTHPLPIHARTDPEFAKAFLKAHGYSGSRLRSGLSQMGAQVTSADAPSLFDSTDEAPWERAGLQWHVRAWGLWALDRARRQLSSLYPVYAEWEAVEGNGFNAGPKLTLLEGDSTYNAVERLNADFDKAYLSDPRNARWVAKPTVAYLWARTVSCKACRATVPLLRTRWLCRREGKRVLLTMEPNLDKTGVVFTVRNNVPVNPGTAAQRREADKQLGLGTMSRTGARCPCCRTIMTMADLQYEAKAGRFGNVMTAVVVEGRQGKEYRDPTPEEHNVASVEYTAITACFEHVPFGVPKEPISTKRPSPNTRGVSAPTRYGLDRWDKLFSPRQLLMMGTFVLAVRAVTDEMKSCGYSEQWQEAVRSYCALAVDRLADYGSSLSTWTVGRETLRGTWGRFALAMVWDYCEANPFSGSSGNFGGAVEWIAKVIEHTTQALEQAPPAKVRIRSAMKTEGEFDAVITDPPYYDAIPYSDCMDYFHVWLRRSLHGLSPDIDEAFARPLGPKWEHDVRDGELIDDVSRFDGNGEASRANFEAGMEQVLRRCAMSLRPGGRLILVFANKSPTAWATLVSAVIKAGFVVEGSLPIQTERASRSTALAAAALSSSVWLVCRKRPPGAQPGWSGRVLADMRSNIAIQMRRFWDAGIRGPDFVWAATGPALEAFSRHPVVFREAASSGQREPMSVSEFLREVRRLVIEFAVGRVLTADGGQDGATGLDDVTTYYLLHRDTFGMEEAPIGACILYAVSCGVSDSALVDQYEILSGGAAGAADTEDPDEEGEGEGNDDGSSEAAGGSGSKVRLIRWDQRKRKTLGIEGTGGRPVPMIDKVHRLMRLWKDGDVTKVDAYLEQGGLARDPLFAQVLQAIIELARRDGKPDEASLLESISNHVQARAGVTPRRQASMF